MAHDSNRVGTNFGRDANFGRQIATNWRGTYRLAPERRLDDRDVRNLIENLRSGDIPDWQLADARQMAQLMRSSPQTFSEDHSMRMLARLAMGVENRYSRPAHGWQARHHESFDRYPRFRRGELEALAQMQRRNDKSVQRERNVGLGIVALGGLAAIMKAIA